MAKYGIPYYGSKSRIAEWIIELLPASHTLVDLFAGGCAVTHAALLSGKWDNIIANDISDAPDIFVRAIRGEFANYDYVPTREEFFASDDSVVRLLYSFSNHKRGYLWSKDLEPVKVAASKMLSARTLSARRAHYRVFCKSLSKYLIDGDAEYMLRERHVLNDHKARGLQQLEGLQRLQRLQGLERLQRLQGLERLEVLERLRVLSGDYRDVIVPEGATVYADPPYRGTENRAYPGFDHDAFDEWLAEVPFPVYVSEYTPPRGCVVVASRERMCSMAATTSKRTTELLCVQERFAPEKEAA